MSEALWPMPPLSTTTFDGKLYDELFSPELFSELCALMNLHGSREELISLRTGHFEAVEEYFRARNGVENAKTLKEENSRLDKVARDSESLIKSISDLYEFGSTQDMLSAEIAKNPTAYSSPDGHNLAQFISSSLPHSLFGVMAIISDIFASAQRAQIRHNPTEDDRQRELLKVLSSQEPDAMGRLLKDQRLESTFSLDRERRDYRKRSDAPLAFVACFAKVWTELNAGTFNSGHTVEGLRGSKSRAVDAVYLSMRQLDEKCTRARVTTAIRNWEKHSR